MGDRHVGIAEHLPVTNDDASAQATAWLVTQLPRWLPIVLLVVLIALGAWSYPNLAAGGLGGPGGGPSGGPGGGSHPNMGGSGGAPGIGGYGGAQPAGGGVPPSVGGPGGEPTQR